MTWLARRPSTQLVAASRYAPLHGASLRAATHRPAPLLASRPRNDFDLAISPPLRNTTRVSEAHRSAPRRDAPQRFRLSLFPAPQHHSAQRTAARRSVSLRDATLLGASQRFSFIPFPVAARLLAPRLTAPHCPATRHPSAQRNDLVYPFTAPLRGAPRRSSTHRTASLRGALHRSATPLHSTQRLFCPFSPRPAPPRAAPPGDAPRRIAPQRRASQRFRFIAFPFSQRRAPRRSSTQRAAPPHSPTRRYSTSRRAWLRFLPPRNSRLRNDSIHPFSPPHRGSALLSATQLNVAPRSSAPLLARLRNDSFVTFPRAALPRVSRPGVAPPLNSALRNDFDLRHASQRSFALRSSPPRSSTRRFQFSSAAQRYAPRRVVPLRSSPQRNVFRSTPAAPRNATSRCARQLTSPRGIATI